MKFLLPFSFLLSSFLPSFGQASVAYYPFNSRAVFSVSTNPNKLVWADARFQTNSIVANLSTTLCPLINVKRTERANWYVGPGVQFNWTNSVSGARLLEGFSLHVGTRVAPIASVPNLRVAFELSPFVNTNASSVTAGTFFSYLGVAWQFTKRTP